jgi:hypothetical protein
VRSASSSRRFACACIKQPVPRLDICRQACVAQERKCEARPPTFNQPGKCQQQLQICDQSCH